MEIILLGSQKRAPETSIEIPEKWSRFRVPNATTTKFTRFASGDVLTQSIKGRGICIWKHVVEVRKSTAVTIKKEGPMLNLYYLITGSLVVDNEDITQNYHDGSYYLSCIPATDYEIYLERGFYDSVHISLSKENMEDLPIQYPLVKALLNHAKEGFVTGGEQYIGLINPKIRFLLNQIAACREIGRKRDLFIRAKILELLVLMEKDLESRSDQVMTHDAMERVKAYILGHLDRTLTISDLAKQFKISERSLTRKFKENTGETIQDFILSQRMALAREYLAASKLPINEIAFQVGYTEVSNFSRSFSRIYGESPMSFRGKMAETDNTFFFNDNTEENSQTTFTDGRKPE